MNHVLQIRLTEPVSVDQDRLGGLYADLGTDAAEDVVCRAMEELALRLSHCDRLYRRQDWQNLRKSARSLVAIAEQIGMIKLSNIAGDVTQCIDALDDVALAATLGRLMRIGEASLTAIWDLQDLSV